MKGGRNVLGAHIPGGVYSSYANSNYPNGGPICSGPQLQPWTCQKDAVDDQCNQPPVYSYLYKSTTPFTTLQAYDPAHPATDVAMTTTDEGTTVPFIVRVETGYQDRDQYRIATLFQPGKPWTPWAPQPQWNHKLLISHGGSRSEEHTSELQSLIRTPYAVFCLNKKIECAPGADPAGRDELQQGAPTARTRHSGDPSRTTTTTDLRRARMR